MVSVEARFLSAATPLSSSPASQWQRGGACSSRASALSSTTSRKISPLFLPRASSSRNNTTPPSSDFSFNLLPPEDVGYVVKLTAVSVAGAAAIKYGSVLLPGMTRPNLVEALLMTGVPVVIAVIWLAVASLRQREEI